MRHATRRLPAALWSCSGAAEVFDHVRWTGSLPSHFAGALTLVGLPGEPSEPPQPGDVLIVRESDDGMLAETYVIEQAAAPWARVRAVAGGAPAARALLDGSRLRSDVLLLRPADGEGPTAVPPGPGSYGSIRFAS